MAYINDWNEWREYSDRAKRLAGIRAAVFVLWEDGAASGGWIEIKPSPELRAALNLLESEELRAAPNLLESKEHNETMKQYRLEDDLVRSLGFEVVRRTR